MSKLSPGEVESLSQLRKVSGTGGFKYLAITTAHTGLSGYAIVCNTDCIFSVFGVDGTDTISGKGDPHGLSGKTIKAGSYLPVAEGSAITSITMSAGDCLIYNL
tara:strand:- start:1004 stop:1315 length:312 start_codon:yes stop_codon:yes gene_type:complete